MRLSGSGGFDNDFATPLPAYSGPFSRRQNWREAVDLNGIVQLNANTQFSLDFSHSQTQNNSIDPSYSLSHAKHITSSAKGELDADTSFGLIQVVAYTNWIAGDITEATGEFDFDNQSTVVQLEDALRIGTDHVVSATFEFRHNEVKTTPFTGGRISYDTPSISGMWAWTISPSLSWTNAVRFDSLTLGRAGTAPAGYPLPNSAWNGNNMSQWGFNSGLVWKASPDDTLRLLASRGIALPSLANLGALVLTTPVNATGNPDLKASAVMNYELDWDRQIDAIGAFLRTALFYQRTTRIISLAGGFIPGPPDYSTTANIGSSDAIGGEVSLRGEFLANWHWGASYRFESIKDSFIPVAQNGAALTDFQHVTPRHQIKANLGWVLGAWETDAAVYYQSATQGLYSTPTGASLTPVKAYFNADARIGYRINNNLTLSVSGQNLLQSQQVQTSGPAIERRIFVNLAATY
ncbi:MAG TPA: TonB-dependent receptor [Rhizomicrobium sp.]|nr:TonB-dependent receptor [Rhizomicrobium sp.]